MKDTRRVKIEPDGMTFDEESVVGEPIAEDADYQGVRITLRGKLGNARVSLQIDIGFGDVVSPRPTKISHPTILDFPAPKFWGYTRESAIAEKFRAMVKLGTLNGRMKDFYDIWLMSRMFDFKGQDLAKAIGKTFGNRDKEITADSKVFDREFRIDKIFDEPWIAPGGWGTDQRTSNNNRNQDQNTQSLQGGSPLVRGNRGEVGIRACY